MLHLKGIPMDKELERVKQELSKLKGVTIHTIGIGAEDEILDVSEKEGLLVGTHRSPDGQWVKWEWVLQGYDHLRKHGEATNKTASGEVNREAFGYRGAIIMSLLAELSTVEIITRRPKKLGYLPEGLPTQLRRETQSRPRRHLMVVIEKDEDGYYVASVPELRGCHTQGKTLDEVIENIRDAASLCLEVEQEDEEVKMEFIGVHTLEI